MAGLRADLAHIDYQIDCLSREINESLRSLGFPQQLEDVSEVSRPRHVTSTPDVRQRDMFGDNGRNRPNDSQPTSLHPVHDLGMHPEMDRNRMQARSKHRNFVKPATYDGSGQ